MALPPKSGRSAADFLPARRSLPNLRGAAAHCRGCSLYRAATQTVFGIGLKHAQLFLIGEQPGNVEDLKGKPFVGPAGQLLTSALQAAGLGDRTRYVTNAVKHFKFQRIGKRRLHQKPRDGEVQACHPWLEAELQVVRPELIICLGATAAYSLFGKKTPILANRGKVLPTAYEIPALITVHPSSVLRTQNPADRAQAFQALVSDLSNCHSFRAAG